LPDPAAALRRGSPLLPLDLPAGGGAQEEFGAAVSLVGREFARAVAQGLVQSRAPGSRRPDGDALARRELDWVNFSVTTGIDRDTGATGDRPGPTAEGSFCVPESDVDIAAWSDPKGRFVLSERRHAAVSEDGGLSPDGSLALARYYLSLGFGAEAAALAPYMPPGLSRDVVLALADIIDNGGGPAPVLSGQAACDGDVALWALMGGGVEAKDLPRSTARILAAFSRLPLPLRAHLSPVLAQRLQTLGEPEDARVALDAVTRAGGSSATQELTAARLGLTGTRAGQARKVLERLATGTGVTSAEALLELFLDAERRGVDPDPGWVDNLPSLVRAVQGTAVAERLNVAGMRGRIRLGRFDALRRALAEPGPGLTPKTRKTLAATALDAAAETAGAADFLRTELGLGKLIGPRDLDRAARYRVAGRLLSLGLAGRALALLPGDPAMADELQITASALRGTGDVNGAIALLSQGERPELQLALAETYDSAGRMGEAVAPYLRADKVAEATRSAIRESDWNWVRRHGVTDLAGAAAALTASVPAASGPAAGNASLLSGAEARRRAAEILLSATRVQAGGGAGAARPPGGPGGPAFTK